MKRFGIRTCSLGVCALLIFLIGCGRDLIFTTYTTVGIEMKGVNNVPTAMRLAYKRFEGALIPVDFQSNDQEKHKPAHSVYATMDVKTEAFGVHVAQLFATGNAARAASGFDPKTGRDGAPGFDTTFNALRQRVGLGRNTANGGP